MTFATKVQSLVGAHSGIYDPAIDWTISKIYETSGSYISRYGVLTGLEEAFADQVALGISATTPLGLTTSSNIVTTGPGAAFNGGIQTIDASTLTRISNGAFSGVNYGLGSYASVLVGSQEYNITCGNGAPLGGTHSIIICQDTAQIYYDGWPAGNNGGTLCAGPPGLNTVYLATAPTASGNIPQTVTIQAYLCGASPSKSTVIVVSPTDIDAGWTEIYFGGFCLDKTDNNLLVFFSGQTGATTLSYLTKIDVGGSISWTHAVTNNGSNPAGSHGVMANSSITHSQYGYVCTAGTPTITIVDTTDGSTISTQTTGLNGLTMPGPTGCYNDTLGCIVSYMSNMYVDADSATLLNTTPSSFSGYGVLYITEGYSPPSTSRRFLAQSRPIRRGPHRTSAIVPITDDARITESGDIRITMEADIRIVLP